MLYVPVPNQQTENWASVVLYPFLVVRISMDLVSGFPPTVRRHDCIFVVVDRFSKMAKFIPRRNTSSAHDLAQLLLDLVWRSLGLPSSIVSDRDPRFVGHFWRSLWKRESLLTFPLPSTHRPMDRLRLSTVPRSRVWGSTTITLLPDGF